MNGGHEKASRLITSKGLACLTVGILVWPIAANAQGSKSLEGAWDVAVTLRDCANGASIRSFPRMITFHKGGSLTESTAAGTDATPVARSVGQGTWEYLGNQQFSYSLKFLRLTAFGGPDGFIRELRTLNVDPSGLQYEADGIAHITLANGFVVGPICATEIGTRLF